MELFDTGLVKELEALQKYISKDDLFLVVDIEGKIIYQNNQSILLFGELTNVFQSNLISYKSADVFKKQLISHEVYYSKENCSRYDLFFRFPDKNIVVINGYLNGKEATGDTKPESSSKNILYNFTESLFQNSEFGVLLLDQQLQVVKINKRAENILGSIESDLLNKSIYELASDKNKEKRIRKYNKVLDTGKPIEFEDDISFSNGIRKRLFISAFRTDEGVLTFILDFTKIKSMESELFQKKKSYQNFKIYRAWGIGCGI